MLKLKLKFKKIKNQHGISLLLAVLILAGMLATALVASDILIKTFNITGKVGTSEKAYYAAETAAEIILNKINHEYEDVNTLSLEGELDSGAEYKFENYNLETVSLPLEIILQPRESYQLDLDIEGIIYPDRLTVGGSGGSMVVVSINKTDQQIVQHDVYKTFPQTIAIGLDRDNYHKIRIINDMGHQITYSIQATSSDLAVGVSVRTRGIYQSTERLLNTKNLKWQIYGAVNPELLDCGDGELDHGEQCDGKPFPANCNPFTCQWRYLYTFVTSQRYMVGYLETGGEPDFDGDNLDRGVDDADYKCQTLARAANLPGQYRAWISDPWRNAKDEIYNPRVAELEYRLPDHETIVVDNFYQLVPTSDSENDILKHEINQNEHGVIINSEDIYVATGTSYNGNKVEGYDTINISGFDSGIFCGSKYEWNPWSYHTGGPIPAGTTGGRITSKDKNWVDCTAAGDAIGWCENKYPNYHCFPCVNDDWKEQLHLYCFQYLED
ncbi:MAG: hypothetical protein PHS07_02265 [Patescibacteria group bacterium]|nr:hypothetical protein [Patescibacteria group bacterium]